MHSNRQAWTQMTPTVGTLWKIMGVMGYEDAVYYEKLHDLKSVVHPDGPKQTAECSVADGYAVSFLPEHQARDSGVIYTLNSINEVQNKKLEKGGKVKMERCFYIHIDSENGFWLLGQFC